MLEELKVRIEQEFEHLTAKLGRAINAYDARLVDHIEKAKQNVLQHVGDHAVASSEPAGTDVTVSA